MNEKPYISRKEQARLTKRKIFDTTMLLIKKKGYGKITIREICQSAQISIGTFYLYFSSKEDILLDIYNKIDQRTVFPTVIDSSDKVNMICRDFKIYLTQMIDLFEKDLLREIYRNGLSSCENHFLNPERPLYQTIYSLVCMAAPETSNADTICHRIFMFVQSYIFQWLIDNDLENTFITETCPQELANFLTLYL